jgi:hypothetical protein
VFSEWLQAVLEHKTQLLLVRLVEAGIGQRFLASELVPDA